MPHKQSLDDRVARLNQGCCPVHGYSMSQIDEGFATQRGDPFMVVGCSAKGCPVKAKAYDIDGPWELFPECADVLSPGSIAAALAAPPKKIPRVNRAKPIDIWAKTNGKCYWCGVVLDFDTTFCIDHVIPRINGGNHTLQNVAPSCKSCNSAKGTSSIEEFRFRRAMQAFEARTGVKFSLAQLAYLSALGVELNIPPHTFWFEK